MEIHDFFVLPRCEKMKKETKPKFDMKAYQKKYRQKPGYKAYLKTKMNEYRQRIKKQRRNNFLKARGWG